jgi:hypothetical protein
MASKIEIRFGGIELNMEGTEAFLSKEIPGLLRSLAELSLQMRGEHLIGDTTSKSPIAKGAEEAPAPEEPEEPPVPEEPTRPTRSRVSPTPPSMKRPIAAKASKKGRRGRPSGVPGRPKAPGKAAVAPPRGQTPGPTLDPGESTRSLALRMGAKSCSDVAKAAVAYLALAAGRQRFERNDVLSEMREAGDLFRKTFPNNLFKAMATLHRQGYVRIVGASEYEVTPDGRAKLALALKAKKTKVS